MADKSWDGNDEQRLQMMRSVAGNNLCADCRVVSPEWTSINLGVLVCVNCSGFHRKMGTHISQVKSLLLDVDCWKGEMLKFMCSKGNKIVNEEYEANVPLGYMRPQDYEHRSDVRENFIRAKWERKEFIKGSSHLEDEGMKDGFLSKSSGGRGPGTMQRRWFVLSGLCLSYYKNPTDETNKGVIPLQNAKVELSKDEDDKLEYIFTVTVKDRSYILQATSNRELFDWINIIRGNVVRHEKSAEKKGAKFRTLSDLDTHSLHIEKAAGSMISGSVKKKGPLASREMTMFSTKWVWHWGTLIEGCLIITKSEEDHTVISVLLLDYCKIEQVAKSEISKEHTFVIRNYSKQSFLSTDNGASLNDWLKALNDVKEHPCPHT